MEKVKLGDVCILNPKDKTEDMNMRVSFVPMQAVSEDGKMDISETRNISEVCKGYTSFVENDVLMAKITPCFENGKCAVAKGLVNSKGYGSTEFIVFRPNQDKVTSSWIYYYTISGTFRANCSKNMTGTAGQKRVPKAFVEKQSIPVPSIVEQNDITHQLDLLREIIEKRKEELNLLDDLIKARFVELFGMPLDKSKANMKFTDCVEFNPKKSEVKDMQNVEVSFVPMECVGVDGSFTIRENGLISNYYKGYTYFRDGDVLLAKITPCFENGKAAIAEGCKNGIGFGTTEFHVARPKAGVSNSYWIKYMLKNDSVHDLATINMTGSAGQKRIQTPFFDKLTIFCPPIELQNQFADFVKQVDKSKVAVQKSLDETQILFDSLMQKYFG